MKTCSVLLYAFLLNAIAVSVQAIDPPQPQQNTSAISLEIRCTTNVFKLGDEIPIQFIINNRGTKDYKYDDREYDRSGRMPEYKLIAKTASGERVPDARLHFQPHRMGGLSGLGVLHPDKSFTKIIPLNLWALINEPGQYEVVGTYFDHNTEIVSSNSIDLSISPRTKSEMDDYIQNLTNNFGQSGTSEDLVKKLMYTCSPNIVPILLKVARTESGNSKFWAIAALSDYVPHTAESRKAILEAAREYGLNGTGLEQVLLTHEFNNKEMRPVIERALAADNTNEWHAGVWLALQYYDDDFTPRLIAIANDPNARWDTRSIALRTLTFHRTDAGVNAIKIMLKNPAPDMLNPLFETIANGYSHADPNQTGKFLRPEDLSADDLRPLIERLLISTNQALQLQLGGVILAKQFGSDAVTAQLIPLTTNSSPYIRGNAVDALALNRTDGGVKTLKMLLNDSNPNVAKQAEAAIRSAYTSRGDARGRPLRTDDFDVKLQKPEVTPTK